MIKFPLGRKQKFLVCTILTPLYSAYCSGSACLHSAVSAVITGWLLLTSCRGDVALEFVKPLLDTEVGVSSVTSVFVFTFYECHFLYKMEKILHCSVLSFGLFSMAGFYSLLLFRFTSADQLKCFVPGLLLADPVYVFVACR